MRSISVKAQVFSSDLFVGLTIFLVGLAILIIFWNYTNYRIQAKIAFEDLSRAAFSISNIFFMEGKPEYWSPENVVVIGLSNDERLNWTKINYLKEMGYEKVREMLSSPYSFNLKLINTTDNSTIFNLTDESNSNAAYVVKVERYSILNSTIVKIEVILWG